MRADDTWAMTHSLPLLHPPSQHDESSTLGGCGQDDSFLSQLVKSYDISWGEAGYHHFPYPSKRNSHYPYPLAELWLRFCPRVETGHKNKNGWSTVIFMAKKLALFGIEWWRNSSLKTLLKNNVDLYGKQWGGSW